MLSTDPLPADQTFTAIVNTGYEGVSRRSETILQTRGDLVRIFYSAAENLSPSIDVFVRRSVEVDSTDRAATNTARITATRYDGDGNNAGTGSITVASAMDHMNWDFLSGLVTHWLGTSLALTYVLPQSANQDPVTVDMDSFQSMIDEYNKLPDGERQLSLVIRDAITMTGVAKKIVEETAQEVGTEVAITEEVRVRYWVSVARDAEAGAKRAEKGAAQASIQAGRQVKYAEASESRTKASEAHAKLSAASANTQRAEAELAEVRARNWAAEAKISALRARDAMYQVTAGVAKLAKTAKGNDALPGPAAPAFEDEGLGLSKMFEEGGDIGQLVPGAGASAPTVPTMAPVFPATLFEPAGGHVAEEEVVVVAAVEVEAEEAEEESDEDEDEDEGEDEAASPTPAELLAAGNHVGNDGRRNHQREGRYYCPGCGASIRTLGEATS
ncbi:hypothetical protein HOY82DRAFT_534563 [Tuber indicum]|nr:hypothetical protein HOY82DRAFT_534563 [Tuber indicum]